MLKPRILLLDEPTSALDVSVQAEILNLLADLRSTRGLSYVLVTHNMSVAAHMSDRILVVDRGAIVEELSGEQLRHHEVISAAAQLMLSAYGRARQNVGI